MNTRKIKLANVNNTDANERTCDLEADENQNEKKLNLGPRCCGIVFFKARSCLKQAEKKTTTLYNRPMSV